LKGFLVFCVVVVSIGLLGVALPYLKGKEKQHEERLVGALNFTEQTIEAALDLHAGLYKPSIAPASTQGHWVVSGIMVAKDGLSGSGSAPFSAVLESVCSDSAKSSCWRMIELDVDGQRVEAARLAGLAPDGAAQGSAATDGAKGQTPEGMTSSLPAELPADEATTAPAEPFEASPTLAAPPVEAAAASPLPATPAPSEVSATPDTGNGGSSFPPVEIEISRQVLTRFVQDALKRLNYEPGPSDGKLGPQTANAIKAYQRDFSLVPDGRPSIDLLRHLREHLGDFGQQSRDPSDNTAQPSG
jgi:hypothetical protein